MLYIIGYVVIFMIYFTWCGHCLNKLPGDILTMKEMLGERNWGEFFIELGIFLFLWAVVIIPLFYLIPTLITGYASIGKLLESFGII